MARWHDRLAWLRTCASLAMCTLLVACGGGGGGDGEVSVTPTGAERGAPVKLSLLSPVRIEADIAAGEFFPFGDVKVGIAGDVTPLAGNDLFIIVEDPASLLRGAPNLMLDFDRKGATLSFTGRIQETAGTFEGEIKMHACLDAECRSEFLGSPLRLPFQLRVRPGLVVPEQQIAVSASFGKQAATRAVAVSLPENLLQWGAGTSTPMPGIDSPLPRLLVSTSGGPDSTPPTVLLNLRPGLPGTYIETATVFASTGLPGMMRYDKTITVTYTVTPDEALDVAIFPPAALLTGKADRFQVLGDEERAVLAMPGVLTAQREIQYLTYPPEAEGNPLRSNWWIDFSRPAAQLCEDDFSGKRTCLPPGRYTARIRYEVVKNGASTDLFWPVTLELTP